MTVRHYADPNVIEETACGLSVRRLSYNAGELTNDLSDATCRSCQVAEMSNVELLETAITKSGLSLRQFAQRVLTRDARTVRRWVSGRKPMPLAAVAWLRNYLEAA